MNAILEALQFEFMRNALTTGLLISIACGIIGTYVVLNRIVFISGGVAHAAYGGIGLGYFLNINPILGAIVFSLAASFSMITVQRKTRERADTIIGVMWAIGMAVGIIFIDLAEGYKADLMSYLFGSILAVSKLEIWMMLVLDIIILLVVTFFYRELLAMSFDETFSTVQNVPVKLLQMIMIALVGLTVVMLMRVVGLIMIIALLTMPAAISNLFVKDMKKMMILSCILGIFFTISGLWLSYFLNLTSGATIILVAGITYLFSHLIKSMRGKKQHLV